MSRGRREHGGSGIDWLILPLGWGAVALIVVGMIWKKFIKGWLASFDSDILVVPSTQFDFSYVTTFIEWIIGIGILIGVWLLVGPFFYQKLARKNVRWKRIILHADTQHDGKQVERLITSLWEAKRSWLIRLLRGREWFQFLMTCVPGDHPEGEILLYVGYPQDRDPYIGKEILSVYPNAELIDIPLDQVPQPFLEKGIGGKLIWQYPKQPGLPLKSFDGSEEISQILNHLTPGAYFSIAFSPVSLRKLRQLSKETRDAVIQNRKGNRFAFLHPYFEATPKVLGRDVSTSQRKEFPEEVKEVLENLKKRHAGQTAAFDTEIYIWHEADDKRTVESIVNKINAAVKHSNRLRLDTTRKSPIRLAPYPFWKKVMTWTGSELANLIHFPKGKTKYEKENRIKHIMDRIPHLIQGQNPIGANDFLKGIPFGYVIHPAYAKRMLYIAEKKLRKMALILGKIGSGKTALILMMIRLCLLWKLVRKEPMGGLTFIDPKGDGVKTALTYFQMLRAQGHDFDESKVHYFDLTSDQYCIGLNLLDLPGQTEDQRIANIIAILQNAYSSDSAWLKKYARPTIRALLRDKHEKHTILAIPEFLRKDSPLRERIKSQLKKGNVSDQALYRKLEDLEDKFGGHEVEPFLNRLDELIENPVTQRIFGQKETNLEILRYLEEGHFVFFNVEGLAEQKEAMKLVMGMIVTLYHQAAQVRHNQSQNHYLVIDEAHQCQIPVLYEQVIPKDRSKGLIAILMTQYLDQFVEPLKKAISEVSGHIFAFTCGSETAKKVQEYTGNRFKAEDVVNLPELEAAVYTESDSGERVSFRIRVEPPYIMLDGKPTYYGPQEERQAKEEREAFQKALQEFGLRWMQRDCLSVEEVQKQIDAYREKLGTWIGMRCCGERIINNPRQIR
ncbi:type IV secretory system conjugative DNA transfer family protein [Thermoactinomyces sp. CICC 10521]|uniref:type IV secretory system conjugative DNA transfer family protein n=1 Tax=Thermoactinomyces sp. CICC 10521 TaxID=2767426 RepID=UPI0018DCBA28|nr:hypothetical protein [Thermoactinomyces sp. CICC 10521]MBH8608951.1 hypothetical protein [Thermoactinomyces sp. CICC 10521]